MIKKTKIIGFIFIIVGISIPVFVITKDKATERSYIANIENKLIESNSYFAIIDIPKINLKRELYPINSDENQVDKNIMIHNASVFPGGKKSNIILASHSGSGSNAYFKNLYKLKVSDIVNLYYKNQLFEYEIKEIEYQAKTGNLYLKEDYNNMLTLITCTYQNNKTQTIYYAKLKNVQKNE